MAFKLGRAFGAGMGTGRDCGAVTGAFLVLGMILPNATSERDARFKSYDLAREFTQRFEALHGTIVCRELLGVDLSTKEGREKAVKENLFRTLCPVMVRDAAQILLKMIG
jgi:C_GCAxxG_C_C family probable redox protein